MSLPAFKDIHGAPLTPALEGKVLFVMNVASACGLTKPGYELFKKVTEKFDPAKFAAVGVPCNAFAAEEPGTADEIRAFADARVKGLHLTEKTEVNGDDPHPLIKYAKSKLPGDIEWNFDGRYVFDKTGAPVARFNHKTPDDVIIAEIEKYL